MREALSNVARHAKATSAAVTISVTADEIRAEVSDDGIGPPAAGAPRGNGLDNLAKRASQAGGAFTLRPRDGGGTVADWRVPRG